LNDANGKCHNTCAYEFNPDPVTRKCERCPFNCKLCRNKTKCSECLDRYYLLDSNLRCSFSCPSYFYPNNLTKKCDRCKDNCKICSGSSNCEYQGLDDKGYVKCKCKGISKEEKSANKMQEFVLNQIPKFNVEIIECYYVGLKYPEVFRNPVFYIGIIFILGAFAIAYFCRNYSYSLIRNSFKEVLFNNCKFFDKNEMIKEDYFNFNIKKPIKDDNKYKKIQACIEEVMIKTDSNKNTSDKELRLKVKKKKNQSPAPVGVLNKAKIEAEQNNKLIDNNKSTSIAMSSCEIIINKVDDNVKKYFMFKKITNKTNKKNRISKLMEKEDAVINDMKMFRLNRRNIYERYPGHAPTLRDYECLSPYDAVLCDRRTFKQLFWSILIEEHVVLSLFQKTIMEPLWIRIVYFFFNLTLIFAINALFFTDDYIDKRANNPEAVYIYILII
jgi:hypothetical protein